MNSTITLCWLNESSRVVEAKTYPGASGYFSSGDEVGMICFCTNLYYAFSGQSSAKIFFFQFSHTFPIFLRQVRSCLLFCNFFRFPPPPPREQKVSYSFPVFSRKTYVLVDTILVSISRAASCLVISVAKR